MAFLTTIQQEWEAFEKTVLPANAPVVQRTEMRMAFFSGAWLIITRIDRLAEPDISEEDACQELDSLKRQIVGFKTEYMRHYAEGN